MKPALTMVFLIATLVALPICGYAEEIDWDKFVDHAQRIGFFGEWTTDAVTKDIWVGIPLASNTRQPKKSALARVEPG